MAECRSEIRDSDIGDLAFKGKKGDYGAYLRRIQLEKVRAFSGETVEFDFPVTALIGANAGGKRPSRDNRSPGRRPNNRSFIKGLALQIAAGYAKG
jgi:hypothetical protein